MSVLIDRDVTCMAPNGVNEIFSIAMFEPFKKFQTEAFEAFEPVRTISRDLV